MISYTHIVINKVTSYDLNNDIYSNENGIFKISNNKIKLENNNIRNLIAFGKYTVLLDDYNKPLLYFDELNYNYFDKFRVGSVKYPFIEFYKKETLRKYGVFNFDTKQILFETTEWIGRDIIGEHIFSNYQGFITCRSVCSANPKWQYNLEELGTITTINNETKPIEIRQFIGVYNSILWIYLSTEWIAGIDINTGSKKHLLKGVSRANLVGDINEYLEEKETLRFLNTKYTLDESTGVIHGIIYDKYYQIDVSKSTPKASVFGMQTKFKEKGISPGSIDRRYMLQNNKLYFAAYEQGCFGILNTQTKEIEYFSEPFTEHRLKEIQVSGDKVYVQDQNNTLFIFQKEVN